MNGNAIEQTDHELVSSCAIQLPNKLIAYHSTSPTSYTGLETCLKRVYSLELLKTFFFSDIL